jgi:hypothetical protein
MVPVSTEDCGQMKTLKWNHLLQSFPPPRIPNLNVTSANGFNLNLNSRRRKNPRYRSSPLPFPTLLTAPPMPSFALAALDKTEWTK